MARKAKIEKSLYRECCVKHDGDTVIVTLTVNQHEQLLLALGLAASALSERDGRWILRLVNAVCEGSPSFVPYAVPEDES
jgi:hypothetical protein